MKNNYEIRGSITAIYIKYKDKILTTIIDTEDLAKVKKLKGTWKPTRDRRSGSYYVRGSFMNSKGKMITIIA